MILRYWIKDILKIFPCCKVMCATMSTPTLIAQTGQTYTEKAIVRNSSKNCFHINQMFLTEYSYQQMRTTVQIGENYHTTSSEGFYPTQAPTLLQKDSETDTHISINVRPSKATVINHAIIT